MYDTPKSPFEIRVRFLGIEVQIRPMFWLFAGLLAGLLAWQMGAFQNPPFAALIIGVDVACFLISVLVGYLTPAFVYRSYGLRSIVVIQDLGGGVFPEAEPPTRLQRIVAAAAQPIAHLALFAAIYYSDQEFKWQNTNAFTKLTYLLLKYINFYWAIILSLPIYPFPGGKILLEVATLFNRKWGTLFTLGLSFLLATIIAALSWLRVTGNTPQFLRNLELGGVRLSDMTPGFIGAILFTLIAMRCYQTFEMARRQFRSQAPPAYDDDVPPWERR